MAKHTFVTASHTTWDETETIDILSRTDVRKIVLEEIERETEDFKGKILLLERKLAKASEQAAKATKGADEAGEEVKRLVETARESFRTVMEELLEPHYRFLAEHLGVKAPIQTAQPKAVAMTQAAKSKSVSAKATKNTAGKQSKVVRQTSAPSKKTVSTSKAKGSKSCQKK